MTDQLNYADQLATLPPGMTDDELTSAIAEHEAAQAAEPHASAEVTSATGEPWRIGRDASDPTGNLNADGACDIACGYIGGMTPHVWTPQQWAEQTARFRFPIWVCDFAAGEAVMEAINCLRALEAAGFPKGTTVMADLETQKPPPTWYEPFAKRVQAGGYKVVGYGSISTLFTHYAADGWIVADPTGVPHMYPHAHTKGTQWAWESLGQTSGPWDQGSYHWQETLPLAEKGSHPPVTLKGVVVVLPDGAVIEVTSTDNGRHWQE